MCKYCSDPKKACGNGHVAAMLYGMEKKASGRESQAPDKDTPERKLQQKINMLGNLYVSGLAMSDTQAGGKTLDNDSEYSSHTIIGNTNADLEATSDRCCLLVRFNLTVMHALLASRSEFILTVIVSFGMCSLGRYSSGNESIIPQIT